MKKLLSIMKDYRSLGEEDFIKIFACYDFVAICRMSAAVMIVTLDFESDFRKR